MTAKQTAKVRRGFFCVAALAFVFWAVRVPTFASRPAQDAPQRPADKSADKAKEPSQPKSPPKLPAQIELLETRVHFEANGDSRKEVHAVVKINDELGVRQFGRLNFSYNRAFQSVEIPLAHIKHANGGTLDVLPSAITDSSDPAVVDFPAYQDVRVKSIRILGLAPDDILEYRVITTTTHHPLAPDFWFEHTFDRTGVVSEEQFNVVLPSSMLAISPLIVVKNENVRQQLEAHLYQTPGCGMCVAPDLNAPIDASLLPLLVKKQRKRSSTPPTQNASPPPPDEALPPVESGKVQVLVKPSASDVSVEKSSESGDGQASYTWHYRAGSQETADNKNSAPSDEIPDVQIGKNSTWRALSYQLFEALLPPSALPAEVTALSQQLTGQANTPRAKAERIYEFVSQKIKTVDLPLGATGFRPRPVAEIISSGYATQEDKYFLFEALAKAAHLEADLEGMAALISPAKKINALLTDPAVFNRLVIGDAACNCWLDPSLEVAPFGALPASYRGSAALILGVDTGPLSDAPASPMIGVLPKDLPFPSKQMVSIDAALSVGGELTAKASYAMRGDNELLLRVAFHRAPKEKWNEVAQLLALSDGFRGKVTKAAASDPYDTHDPFKVGYEITQPKFLDWSKKPVHIPALLPILGLPDPQAKTPVGGAAAAIDLGTPLDAEVSATVHLPEGTGAEVPAGTSIQRDFATYESHYSVSSATLTASRHINFILRQISADRAAEYNAFLHAVQNDESQLFTLQPAENSPAQAKPEKK